MFVPRRGACHSGVAPMDIQVQYAESSTPRQHGHSNVLILKMAHMFELIFQSRVLSAVQKIVIPKEIHKKHMRKLASAITWLDSLDVARLCYYPGEGEAQKQSKA